MKKKYNTNPAYNQYINSKEWKAKRQEVFDERGEVCEKCGSLHLVQVHHLNYKRFGGKEKMSDLMALCKKCHMEVHDIKYKPKKYYGPKNHKYYRKLARKKLRIKKSGGKGWVSLAKIIAEKVGDKTVFCGAKNAKEYIKITLSKYEA